MAKILKSAMVIGFISLLIYITVNTNQPIEGEKAIKHRMLNDTLYKDTLKKLR